MNDSIMFLFDSSSPLDSEPLVDPFVFDDEELLQQVIAESFDEYVSQVHGSLDESEVDTAVEQVQRKAFVRTRSRSQQQCTVCLDDVGIEEDAVQTRCQHLFHKECLIHWIKSSKTVACPICRSKITQSPRRIN